MSEFMKERCEELGEYIIETGSTVRQTAKHFGLSKSTVHKDVTRKLYFFNRRMYDHVAKILFRNKAERHLRGGEATRQKYLSMHKGDKGLS